MGESHATVNQIVEILKEMEGRWRGPDQDLLNHNCCSFSRELLQQLGVADNFPDWVDQFAKLGSYIQQTFCVDPLTDHFQTALKDKCNDVFDCSKVANKFDKQWNSLKGKMSEKKDEFDIQFENGDGRKMIDTTTENWNQFSEDTTLKWNKFSDDTNDYWEKGDGKKSIDLVNKRCKNIDKDTRD